MRHILLLVLGLLVLAACGEETSPNLICTGTVEVDIHVTRFGADTTARCVVAPPDTIWVPPDTVVTPPDTVYLPRPRCHWHGHHWTCHETRGHHE